jgi:hypothetical protein
MPCAASLRHRQTPKIHLMQPIACYPNRNSNFDPEPFISKPAPHKLHMDRTLATSVASPSSDYNSQKWGKQTSFFVRTVEFVTESISKFTSDGGGEEGLLLPVSHGGRNMHDGGVF